MKIPSLHAELFDGVTRVLPPTPPLWRVTGGGRGTQE